MLDELLKFANYENLISLVFQPHAKVGMKTHETSTANEAQLQEPKQRPCRETVHYIQTSMRGVFEVRGERAKSFSQSFPCVLSEAAKADCSGQSNLPRSFPL